MRIVRAQTPPLWKPPSGEASFGTLATRRVGTSGPPVVLLHGMAGSNLYWGADFDAIGQRARLVAVDLLGFGDSPQSLGGYGPREHADAVRASLQELGIDEPALVVGHSMGTLVALALATHHPEAVDRLIAFSPPIYDSRRRARQHIRAIGSFGRFMSVGPMSRVMCQTMYAHRSLARRVAPWFEPSLPAPIARAAVLHTWSSYSESMERLILAGDARDWLVGVTRPTQLIAARDDDVLDLPLLERLRRENPLVSLEIWNEGGHHLALTQPAKCVGIIEQALRRA